MSQSARDRDRLLAHVSEVFAGSKPKSLAVAVSGGSDSMALLTLLAHWAKAEAVDICAVTVDHGLRVEARDEAEQVADHCASRAIAHTILTWSGWDGSGNLQARARDARYSLIAEWAQGAGVDTVALGHSQDDQAETFLMRLARQSGVDGLSGMRQVFARNGVTWLRPLLHLSRAELRAYLQAQDISWSDDPSNEAVRFERVRARQVLETLTPLDISADTLSNVSDLMRNSREALEHYTRREAEHATREDHGDLLLDDLSGVPSEIRRRLLIAGLLWIGGGAYPPRHDALRGLDAAMMHADRHSLAGCVISREGEGGLRVTRELNALRDLSSATDQLWDGRWQLDGPHAPEFEIRALGDAGLRDCPDWRATSLPRQTLLASPAIWRGNQLVAAPLAGVENGWKANVSSFATFLLRRK